MISEAKNVLLKRTEVKMMFESNGNPGFEKSKQEIVTKMKVPADNVVIKSLRNNFGTKEFIVDALVYDSVADKDRVEPKPKVKKAAAGGN